MVYKYSSTVCLDSLKNLSTVTRNEVVPLWPIMTTKSGKIRATDEELNRYHLFLEAIIAQAQSVENHR